ncbi:MAG: 50S ribosomal protein L20 [Tissierellia bacterium]|nr:50S ribosomal protein L20 [Tissierellia bacterium]
MARVKRGTTTKRRHKKVLKQAKGFYGARSKLFRPANQAVMRSMRSAYIGRKQRKRDFRKLWISRINAASRQNGLSYSRFIDGLKKANVDINRKMLSELAIHDPQAFAKLVDLAKGQ